jgi:hypothetical protein
MDCPFEDEYERGLWRMAQRWLLEDLMTPAEPADAVGHHYPRSWMGIYRSKLLKAKERLGI